MKQITAATATCGGVHYPALLLLLLLLARAVDVSLVTAAATAGAYSLPFLLVL